MGDTEVFYQPIPDGESGKNISTLDRLWNTLGASGFTKNDLIIAVGGGAVTDVSGFAAATWLRGVSWIAVPTTVAGMVDAAIGGKTAINTAYGKNLAGAFHSPLAVLIDPHWIKTLSARDISAGLAEVIKCGFISDESILLMCEDFSVEEMLNSEDLILALIAKAVEVKAGVVGVDFKESFAREALNYGHTFGHAVERHLQYQLRHGECVAIGMVFVAEISYARGLISEAALARHRNILQKYKLPVSLPPSIGLNDFEYINAIMSLDKKSRNGSLRFVALSDSGLQRLSDVSSDELRSAYEKVLS